MTTLACCLCLHSRTGVPEPALTVINGQAVCLDHAGYVQGDKFSLALRTVLEQARNVTPDR